MQSKIARALMVLMVFVAPIGCGRAKAPQIQPRGTVVAPAYPVDATQALQLAEAKTTIEFNSNVLLWDQPTGPQVQAILDSTRQTRLLRADALDTINRELIPAKKKVDGLQAALQTAKQKVESAGTARDQVAIRAYIHSVTDQYVETTLKDLVAANAISAADQTHANLLWEGYCEGKLWELAVSPLLSRLYATRPTPNGFCDAYYTRKGYFADAELCGPAASADGKNYFSCIWTAGVLKSPLIPTTGIAANCANVTPPGAKLVTRPQAIASWIARDGSGPLQKALRDDTALPNLKTKTFGQLLVETILGGQQIPLQFKTQSPELFSCRKAFNNNLASVPAGRDVDASGVPYWQQDNPNNLLDIVEAGEGSALRYTLLPKTDHTELDHANFVKLGGVIAPFSVRDKTGGIKPSYSDSQLNEVIGQPGLVTIAANIDVVEMGPLFPKLTSFETKALSDLKAAQANAMADLAKAQDEWDAKKVAFNKVTMEAIKVNITDAAKVGEVEGASVFLNTYVMKIEKDGDRLKVRLAFEQMTDQVQVGCLNIATGSACDLTPEELGPNGHVARITFDRSSSLITLTFDLGEHPENLGFPVHPRNIEGGDIPFNAIAPATLAGKSFQVEVYGNQLRDLPIVTGNAYVLDGDGKSRLYTGSLTGDAFYQIKAQLFQANGLSK